VKKTFEMCVRDYVTCSSCFTAKVGFAAGLGVEYAPDPRWSVNAEALYVDLGKTSDTVAAIIGNPPLSGRFDVHDTMWIVRAGVNYKFGRLALVRSTRRAARAFSRKAGIQIICRHRFFFWVPAFARTSGFCRQFPPSPRLETKKPPRKIRADRAAASRVIKLKHRLTAD
jgi:hypothetical protein